MANINDLAKLNDAKIEAAFKNAKTSSRSRYAEVLHSPGDIHNRVFNFILENSYMHPHLHPGSEKIEKITVIKGELAIIHFNNYGEVDGVSRLTQNSNPYIEIPAFSWHTYVMITPEVITYETMEGVYDPKSWKRLAPWAPSELSIEASDYLASLKKNLF